jgi:hypothetical protein
VAGAFTRGANALYAGCVNSQGTWGSSSIMVNYYPVIQGSASPGAGSGGMGGMGQ